MAWMKWIPVTERLPEVSGEYLVTMADYTGEPRVDKEVYFFDGKHDPLCPEREVDFDRGYGVSELSEGFVGWCFLADFNGYASLCEVAEGLVVAWMPFPEPYKKDTSTFNDEDAAYYLLKKHSEMALKELEGQWRLAEVRHKHHNN